MAMLLNGTQGLRYSIPDSLLHWLKPQRFSFLSVTIAFSVQLTKGA
jgi:hypothetical protein